MTTARKIEQGTCHLSQASNNAFLEEDLQYKLCVEENILFKVF